jgi:hypothetical protein
MSDFLSREADFLGGEFSSSHKTDIGLGDDIDFDRAASAFPDISLDGIGDIPTQAPVLAARANSGFSFDDFDSPVEKDSAVKVTGDDELDKFKNEFPDIQVPQVCHAGHCGWRTDSLGYVICTHISAFLCTRRGSSLSIVFCMFFTVILILFAAPFTSSRSTTFIRGNLRTSAPSLRILLYPHSKPTHRRGGAAGDQVRSHPLLLSYRLTEL